MGVTKSKALRNCEQDSGGVPCKVYAIKRRIVWKGTPAPPKATQTPNQSSKADSDICRFALSTKSEAPNWDDRSASRNSVNEAKRRGLTPETCAKLLGRQVVQVKEAPPKEGNIEDRLTKLKNVYDKGLITKKEYEIKQVEILEGL
jgi:hypothetical protein